MAPRDSRERKGSSSKAGGLKMRELVRASGVPKSTVLFYLSAGLLPPPLRTGPNRAWYDPECVARIELIRRLQREERLSLAEIAGRLREGKRSHFPAPLPRWVGKDPAPGVSPREPACDAESFSRQTRIPPEQLERLVARGLLLPDPEGRFVEEDFAAARALAALLAAGFDGRDLGEYVDAAKGLALLERRLLDREAGGGQEARQSVAARLAALRRYLFVDRLERLADRQKKSDPAHGGRREPEPWLD